MGKVAYVILGVLLLGAFIFNMTSGSSSSAKATATSARRNTTTASSTDPQAEFIGEIGTKFEKPRDSMRNIFMPVVKTELRSSSAQTSPTGPSKVPAALAGGDGNWCYTGMAEIDGKPEALLENISTHQSGFVNEGDHWKKAIVAHIAVDSIVFADSAGIEQTVLRYNPDAVEKPPEPSNPGFRPLQFGSGVIGPKGAEPIEPPPPPKPKKQDAPPKPAKGK